MNDYFSKVELLVAGEQGLVVDFGSLISPEINGAVQRLTKLLVAQGIQGVIEVVPTYRSVMVCFDPLQVMRLDLAERIREALGQLETQDIEQVSGRVVHVPVCYGGDYGPDLDFVAHHTNLSTDEVIQVHTAKPYLVYMLGFTPGFPYLGGMPEAIAAPRLEQPRVKIPEGSVGIAGSQTGLYPIESPGGWRLIGRTPVKAFSPQNPNPFLFAAGDYLQFEAISLEEFCDIRQQVEAGSYTPEISSL